MSLLISSFADDNTGVSDEALGLQNAFNAVSNTNNVLDLEGGTWRYNTQLTLTDTCRIVNGELKQSVPETQNLEDNWGIRVYQNLNTYSRPTFRDVVFTRHQYANKIGLRIERGIRINLDNCRFENYRSGLCVPLQLRGCQGGQVNNLDIDGFGLHGVELTGLPGFTATTDIEFNSLRIINGLSSSPASAVYAPLFGTTAGATGCVFNSGSIENTFGPAVRLIGTRRFRFNYMRFEDIAANQNFISISNPLQDSQNLGHIINGCSFGTSPTQTSPIRIGSNVNSTVISFNTFPTSSDKLIDDGINTVVVGNRNLKDNLAVVEQTIMVVAKPTEPLVVPGGIRVSPTQ